MKQGQYRILNGTLEIGEYDGSFLVEGFKAYTVGEEPQELKDALALETEKELLAKEAQDALNLLNDTQWVESYILRHEQGIITIPYESNKWVLHAQRLDAIALLKDMEY